MLYSQPIFLCFRSTEYTDIINHVQNGHMNDGSCVMTFMWGDMFRRSKAEGSVLHDKFKEDLDIWRSFFRPRKSTVWTYIRSVLFYIIIPLLLVAACLFYFGENPLRGKSEDGTPGAKPSISWYFLFIVRQVVTFSLALATQGRSFNSSAL